MKQAKRPSARVAAGNEGPEAEPIELEGPSEYTLTPPPERRLGVIVALILGGIVVIGLAGLAVAKPEIFVTAVQAFVGGI